MRDYKKLDIWINSKDLAKKVYIITEKFPRKEIFGMASQLRRVAVSISSNIAEGSARTTDKDFNNFLNTSLGSINEVENLLIISTEIGLLEKSECLELEEKLDHIKRMIINFQKRLTLNNERKSIGEYRNAY